VELYSAEKSSAKNFSANFSKNFLTIFFGENVTGDFIVIKIEKADVVHRVGRKMIVRTISVVGRFNRQW